MEKSESFLVKPPEKPRPPREYLLEELRSSLGEFPEEVRPEIERMIRGEVYSQSIVHNIINKWWQEKYGFPFHLKAAREEMLIRKYVPPNLEYERSVQAKLLKAVEGDDEEKIEELKKELEARHPDQLETIAVILALRDFLRKQEWMNRERDNLSWEEKGDHCRDFTEYQFLFTHFIITNGQNREFLDTFWKVAWDLAERTKTTQELAVLRRGVLSQAASYKIAQLLGMKPRLSCPDEDAFRAIDLWVEGEKALQVKGWKEDAPEVIGSDHIAFPAIEIRESPRRNRYLQSLDFFQGKARDFLAKIKEYGSHIGKEIGGQMLVIPYSKIDPVTGEPAPELVEFFREKLK